MWKCTVTGEIRANQIASMGGLIETRCKKLDEQRRTKVVECMKRAEYGTACWRYDMHAKAKSARSPKNVEVERELLNMIEWRLREV